MDRFLQQNAAQYQSLVKAFNPTRTAKVDNRISSSDMVVSARIRPLLKEEVASGFPSAVFKRSTQPGVVDIHDLYNHPRGRPLLKSFQYEVDRVFDSETTTDEIYSNLVVDLVPLAWNGGIGTVLTYGQTGSGKTFTISRLSQLISESLMDGTVRGERKIYITIIDLAGNAAYDLLNSRKPISLLEDSFGVTQLTGAAEYLVETKEEMMELIERATSFRRTAPTLKNDASSRSHSICRIRIDNPSTNPDGLLYLVDLAGSEVARDVEVHGADRMRETKEINLSLSVLKECIRGKAALKSSGIGGPKRSHVPFRQSALTKVLKPVFDPAAGQSYKTVAIACLNPSLADVGASKNTLRYAELLRVLLPESKKVEENSMVPMTWGNAKLKEWIAKNSGTPPISAAAVAPTESGAQFLLLPAAEIERRCLMTRGVSVEQVKAFRSKMWQLHIDSQRVGGVSKTPKTNTIKSTENVSKTIRSSSRDLDSSAAAVPFKERIRPGMVVSWKEPSDPDAALSTPEFIKLAFVLCPFEAVPGTVNDSLGDILNPAKSEHANVDGNGSQKSTQYLCALVTPAIMAEAYEVSLWQQVVVDVGMMDGEVFLEYDAATRYYYISV